MTLLSRKADYALLILSFLHQKASGGNAREIAERFDLSRPFVANILKELCRSNFVVSHRGVKGGYSLAPLTACRTLAELLLAMEEEFHLTLCSSTHESDQCSLAHDCPVKAPLAEIHRRIQDVLQAVTLGELFLGQELPRMALGLPVLPPPIPAGEPNHEPQAAHA